METNYSDMDLFRYEKYYVGFARGLHEGAVQNDFSMGKLSIILQLTVDYKTKSSILSVVDVFFGIIIVTSTYLNV